MKLGDFVYILFLLLIGFLLTWDIIAHPESDTLFKTATTTLPQLMGFLKFVILATSGELLSRRLTTKKWTFKGIDLPSRAFIWGVIGLMVTYVFPLFAAGTHSLIEANMLPVFSENLKIFGEDKSILNTVSTAFWISLLTNLIFGFAMMIFHRLTDTLIDEGRLWKKWNVAETWRKIDWSSIFGFVWPSIFWFWLPMHTITFSLPPEYRVLMASALGIALGVILSFAKNKSADKEEKTG